MTENIAYNIEEKNQGQRLSLEEWQEMKRAERENLFNEINETSMSLTKDPEKLRTFLDVQSRNNRYSVANCLTLLKHCPEASKLRTFEDWQADNSPNKTNNVFVKKNQTAIPVLEPYDYQKDDGTTGVGYNIKKMFDVSQTNAKGTPAVSINNNPEDIVKALINTSSVNMEVVEELPEASMGAFYNNDKQTLFIQKGFTDNITLFRCLVRELGHAEISIKNDVYSRRETDFSAKCVAYMLCRKYGVYAKNLGIENIPEDWKNMESKEIRSKLTEIRYAMNEISSRVYRELSKQEKVQHKDEARSQIAEKPPRREHSDEYAR